MIYANRFIFLKRTCIYLLGLIITALGIALIIRLPFGTGPCDTVGVGMNTNYGLTIGFWTVLTQSLLIFISSFLDQTRPKFEALIVIIIRSWFLDIWYYIILADINFPNTRIVLFGIFISGVILVGIGIGIYLEARFPRSPTDELMISISNRFHFTLQKSRLILELTGVLFGWLIGGPTGIGTIIIALSLGKLIQETNKIIKRITPKNCEMTGEFYNEKDTNSK